jgi:NSS family neurotransmitter:Na+ symporter
MFNNMENGRLWSSLFFIFISFAAITTVIAVFELIIASFMDRWGWTRQKSGVVTAVLIFVLSIPCALGFNVWSHIQPLGEGTAVIDLLDFILSDNLLPLGALIYLLFCTSRYGWGWDNCMAEADAGAGMKFPKIMRSYLTYVVPLVIVAILAGGYYDKFFK